MPEKIEKYLNYIDQLNSIGVALSSEKNHSKLLEKILLSAMDIIHTDGGTLYLLTDNKFTKDKYLTFEIIINRSLNIKLQREKSDNFFIPPLQLYDENGNPNLKNIATYCFLQDKTIHIPDAYQAEGFDFSGMRATDKKLGYHSKSFLVIPLRNHEKKVIGVIQLINALDDETNAIIPFDEAKIHLAESLASQAATTLTQKELIEAQKKLFEALIQLIARTIDEKSKYTSKHCSRVPILTVMIAEAAEKAQEGYYKDFHLTPEQFEELRISAWLHDCGKIVTPVHVVDKATKLECISDRIEVIDLRLEILKRDLKIEFLEKSMNYSMNNEEKEKLKKEYEESCQAIDEAREFLRKVNIGGEFLNDQDKEKIKLLGKKTFALNGEMQTLLSEKDVKNLCISRGTLNDEDRAIINDHVTITKKILSYLPYPDYLKNVAQIAGAHHERFDGKGYPSGLKGDEIPIQSRMLTIADIFEALTAVDRPYKPAKTLKETLNIMTDMTKSGHIDPHLFDLFMKEKIYLTYGKEYLSPEQIDVT